MLTVRLLQIPGSKPGLAQQLYPSLQLPTITLLLAEAVSIPAKGCGHQPVRGRRHCGLQSAQSQLEVATTPGPLH